MVRVVMPRSSWDEALASVLVPVSVRCGTLPLSVGGAGRQRFVPAVSFIGALVASVWRHGVIR